MKKSLLSTSLFKGLLPYLIVTLVFVWQTGCALEPENKSPTAHFTVSPESGLVGIKVSFDASSSTDPDEESRFLQVRWDLDGDEIWDTRWAAKKTIDHRFSAGGNQVVSLEIRDSGGLTDIYQHTVAFYNMPVPEFSISPVCGDLNTIFSFDAIGTEDEDTDISALEFRWDFESDGAWDTEWSLDATCTHQYTELGHYQVHLEVRDPENNSNTTGHQLDVAPAIYWRYEGSGGSSQALALSHTGEIVYGVVGGAILSIGSDGFLSASYQTAGDRFGVGGGTTIGPDGTVFNFSRSAWDGKPLYALPPGLNSPLWTFEVNDEFTGSVAIGSDSTLYFGSDNDTLYALYYDGRVKWKYPADGNGIWSAPSIAPDGTIYFITSSKRLVAVNQDGTLRWRTSTGNITTWEGNSLALAGNGTVYFATRTEVFALDPNGVILWQFTKSYSEMHVGPVIGLNDIIYIGGKDLYALSPSGDLLWEYWLVEDPERYQSIGEEQKSTTAVIAADGTIYVGTKGSTVEFGFLYAFSTDGQLKWRYRVPGGIASAPTIAPDGTLYFLSQGGTLYAMPLENGGLADSAWPKFQTNIFNTGRK